MRLDKRVADRTPHSRREARTLIRRGRVQVDGQVVRDPKAAVPDGAVVTLDGASLDAPPRLAVLHKPVGVVTTTEDPWGRDDLAGLAADLLALGLHPVGRLDADSEGLLPFSADGTWTQRLLHPRHGVVKVYQAVVEGEIGEDLRERLAAGIATADGVFAGELRHVDGDTLTVAVTEGKHRMVRRMLANAGHPVVSLRRIAFGPMRLGDLAPGAWRPASAAEIAWMEAWEG